MEDKILLYKVRVNRDPDAYALLYDKYVSSIYRYVFFKLSHKEEAEDVTSEIFLKAWRHILDASGENEILNFRTFIYRVARNAIVDVYRDRVKKKNAPLDEAIEMADEKDLLEELIVVEENKELMANIKKLKEEYQEVLLLRFVEELSVGEIAKILEKSNVATRVLLHRAIKKLQEFSGSNNV